MAGVGRGNGVGGEKVMIVERRDASLKVSDVREGGSENGNWCRKKEGERRWGEKRGKRSLRQGMDGLDGVGGGGLR